MLVTRPWLARLGAAAMMTALGLPVVAQDAPTAPGTAGIAVGLDTLRGRDEADLRAEFADFAQLGVRWLRTDIYWADVQAKGPGSYDWSETDHILDLAQEFGIQLLPVVGTTPDWAKKDRDGASTPGNPDSFGRFLTAAV